MQKQLDSRKIIAVDICNTLAAVNDEIEKLTGVVRPKGMYLHPVVCREWFFNNMQVFAHCDVIEGSVKAMNILAKHYDILYLSARPCESYLTTIHWLKENGYPSGKVVFSHNKSLIAQNINISFAIEDAPYELDMYIENNISVYVKSQDYNTYYQNRFDWSNFTDIIPLN